MVRGTLHPVQRFWLIFISKTAPLKDRKLACLTAVLQDNEISLQLRLCPTQLEVASMFKVLWIALKLSNLRLGYSTCLACPLQKWAPVEFNQKCRSFDVIQETIAVKDIFSSTLSIPVAKRINCIS